MPVAIGGMLAMGALSVGSSLMGSMGANSQSQAQAMQQKLQAENANFQRQWQIDAANRKIDRANLARAINNKKIEQVALSDRAIGEVYTKLGYDNAKGQYSKQTNQINAALLSSVSGRNISASSGTARALLRQNLQNATSNMASLRISQMNKMRDIETTYQNKLAQRDFNYEEFNIFMPGDTSTVSGMSTGLMIGQAALAGTSAALSTGLMYGTAGKGPFAV